MDFLGKAGVFSSESLFRVSALLYITSLDFQVEFIISASWFVTPVHHDSFVDFTELEKELGDFENSETE